MSYGKWSWLGGLVLLHEATVAAAVADVILRALMIAINELLLREADEIVTSERPLRTG